jgi:hypothetical protein
MDLRPAVFIGSSTEGLDTANLIQKGLSEFADCTSWKNLFELNKSNYDNLISQIAFFDYAVLIATGDDTLTSRNTAFTSARDNVLFEFGLFAGGLGKERVFYLVEEGIKIPSDISGITLPSLPKKADPHPEERVAECIDRIRSHIEGKEKTFDLSFLPSTALAYGYFKNFVERTVQRLLEDKADGKKFHLASGKEFSIRDLQFTILLPDDLSDDMFNKVTAKRLRDGWEKMKVDPKDVRDYDFSIDVSKVADDCMHLVDIPFTLNALNLSLMLYSQKSHLGKTTKEEILEKKEIRNFKRTLEYLIGNSALAKGIVEVEIVKI